MLKHIEQLAEMRALSRSMHQEGSSVGFVPTMGALHAGHLSLVRAARERCDQVVVSIFVNPTQFGPNEDLDQYPRDLGGDAAKLEAAGADVLFTSTPAAMYPEGFCSWVTVEGLTDHLCGAKRPDHFRGVTTVVCKLFQLVDPDHAFFGEKDRQQLLVIERMVRDLNMRVNVVGCPIVREADGLALSSRNAYLSDEERQRGLALSRGLRAAAEAYAAGQRAAGELTGPVRTELDSAGLTTDYVELVDADTCAPTDTADAASFVAVAAFAGKTRLIDNHVLSRPWPA